MKVQFQHFKLVVTGRAAVSMPSMVLYLPVSFIFAFEREFALTPGSLNDQIKIVLAGEFTSFLFLHISALTLLRKRNNRSQNLYLCLLVWAMTGVIRGYFSEFYATSVLNYESNGTSRIFLSAIFSTLGLALAAYTFGCIYEVQIKKSVLRSLNKFLSVEGKSLNSDQIALKREAIVTLQETLIPKVIQLQTLSAGLKKVDTSALLAQSLQLLEERARHLSYQMRVNLDNVESIPNPRPNASSRKFNITKFPIAFWPHKLSVKLSIASLVIGGVILQYGRNSIPGVLSALLSALLVGTVLCIFDQILKRQTAIDSYLVLNFSYVAVFITQFLHSSRLMPQIYELEESFSPWYSAIKVTLVVFMASFFLSFIETDSEQLNEMSKEISSSRENLKVNSGTIEKLAMLNTITNQGVLQGKISGVILALNMIANDEDSKKLSVNPALVIKNATELLTESIAEIQNVSFRKK